MIIVPVAVFVLIVFGGFIHFRSLDNPTVWLSAFHGFVTWGVATAAAMSVARDIL